MADLIDREEAYFTLTEYYHHTAETQHRALREALDRIPGTEIIHCKDCKYGAQDEDGLWYCTDLHGNTMGEIDKEDTDFCSRAERKEGCG